MLTIAKFVAQFLVLHESKANQVSLSQSHFSYLLQNMTNCDLQILHDGADISILHVPVKVIWMPKYLDIILENISFPAMNVLLSRTAQYKFSFLAPKYVPYSTSRHRLDTWIDISVNYHTYNIVKNTEKRYIHSDNLFIILLGELFNAILGFKFGSITLASLHNTYTLPYYTSKYAGYHNPTF